MVFSTLEFIFRFLPVFLILYYLAPYRFKNSVLFAGSLCFYAFGELKYFVLILISILINYFMALQMDKKETKGYKQLFLCIALVYDIGVLFFFKYINFFIENINIVGSKLFHTNAIEPLSVGLPLGISFYTFQIISYLVDVYKGEIVATKSPIKLGTYLTMFPQLISGPLISYSEISRQLANRRYTLKNLEAGLKLFTIGLGFKVLLANRIGILWNDIQTIGFESISTPLAWLGIYGYSLQLYFDFHGYTLMAIGVGKMLGFHLPDNFNHPYMSKSVTEFWRRWHMTLGKWFRNYVYIPLGGNRKGKLKLILNLLVVWMVTGLWHGSSWNFVLWGLSLFGLILIEKLFLKRFLDSTRLVARILSRIYLLVVIPLTWVLFAITNVSEIKIYFSRLFSITPGIYVNANDFIKYFNMYQWLFLIGIFFSMPFAFRWYKKHENNIFCIIFLLAVFWYSVYQLSMGGNSPFVYFKF